MKTTVNIFISTTACTTLSTVKRTNWTHLSFTKEAFIAIKAVIPFSLCLFNHLTNLVDLHENASVKGLWVSTSSFVMCNHLRTKPQSWNLIAVNGKNVENVRKLSFNPLRNKTLRKATKGKTGATVLLQENKREVFTLKSVEVKQWKFLRVENSF